MADWLEAALGELVDVKHGFAFPGKYIHEEPVGDVLLTPGNFAVGGGFRGDKLKYYDGPVPDEFVLQEGDLLVTMTDLSKSSDTLGYPAFVPSPVAGRRYLHNQRLGKLQVQDPSALDRRFLHYLLCGPVYRNEVLASATGTTVKHTSPDRLKRFRFLLPPLREQEAIGGALSALDDKIELNRRMSETLEAISRTLFKSWFEDFEPVRAKAEGRDPGLPKPIADLFPDSFEDSELGSIPKGWRVGTVGNLCGALFSGGTPSTLQPAYWDGGVPWLSSGETREKFITETERTISEEAISHSSTRLAPAGATVIASAGQGNTRGQTSLLTFDSFINQSVIALVASQESSSPHHLFFDLERRYSEFRRVSDAHSSRGSLTTKLLATAQALLPPKPLVGRFDRIVAANVRGIIALRRQSRTIEALRNALLPKLVSGALRLNRPEIAIETADEYAQSGALAKSQSEH